MKKFIIAKKIGAGSHYFISDTEAFNHADKDISYYLLKLNYSQYNVGVYNISVESQNLIDLPSFQQHFNSRFIYNEELIKDTNNLLNSINFSSTFTDSEIIDILAHDIISYPNKFNELITLFNKKSYDINTYEGRNENSDVFSHYLKIHWSRGSGLSKNKINEYISFFYQYYSNFYSIIKYQQNILVINTILNNPISEKYNDINGVDKNKESVKSENITFKNIKQILYDKFDRDDIKEIVDCLEKELSKYENKVGETK